MNNNDLNLLLYYGAGVGIEKSTIRQLYNNVYKNFETSIPVSRIVLSDLFAFNFRNQHV